MQSKKVLSVCINSDDFLPAITGVGIHLGTLVQALRLRGHRVIILTTRRGPQPDEEEWHGAHIYRLPTFKIFGFYQAIPTPTQIRRILLHEKPDIIHHHYHGFLAKIVNNVARSLRIPQVTSYHFGPKVLTQPLLMRPFTRIVESQIKKFNNNCDRVIMDGKGIVDSLEFRGITTETIHIPLSADLPDIEDVSPAPRTKDFTILSAGRLAKEKNIPLLLDAFAILYKKYSTVTLWIAGTGDEENTLKELCKKLGIAEHVIFLGFLSHDVLAQYYAACDAFVSPSVEDTFSLVAREAMWFGKPTLITNKIISAEELIIDGVDGYIFDPSTSDELVERLSLLMRDPLICMQIGAAARKKASAYTTAEMVASVENVYNSVLQK